MRENKFQVLIKHPFKALQRIAGFESIKSIDFIEQSVTIKVDGEIYKFHFSEVEFINYTGLKDAKGKEIYEGDIVEFKSMSKTERHYVEYSDYGEWCVGMYRLPMKFQSCEVIGNIYENPELLEESQNESK